MNETVLSQQVKAFRSLIEALTPRYAIAKKPYNTGFHYVPSDETRTWDQSGATFRNFTLVQIDNRRGDFVEPAGGAGSKRYSARTTIAIKIVYPLWTGDNAERLIDCINADGQQIRALLETSTNWITGCNGVWVTNSVVNQAGQHNSVNLLTVVFDTREVV
jgi:hypothetical protein